MRLWKTPFADGYLLAIAGQGGVKRINFADNLNFARGQGAAASGEVSNAVAKVGEGKYIIFQLRGL